MRQFENQPSAPLIEALESRRLLSASLVGSFAGHLPDVLPVAGTTRLSVRLTNPGRASLVESATVQIFASTSDNLAGDALLLATQQQIIHLKARASVADRFAFATPVTLPTGSYFLVAAVNSAVLTETPVNIQQPATSLTVNFSGIPSKPIEIDGPSAGQRTATVSLINTGNISINGTVNLRFYLSADGTMNTAQLLQTDANVPISLKPNGSKNVAFRIAIPPGTAPGGYFLLAQLSGNGSLTDAVSTNNLATSSQRVSVVTQLPHPLEINENVNVTVDDSGGGADCAAADSAASDPGTCDCGDCSAGDISSGDAAPIDTSDTDAPAAPAAVSPDAGAPSAQSSESTSTDASTANASNPPDDGNITDDSGSDF
jgi:hypothetical protein